MTTREPGAFPVVWERPEDADLTWVRDEMHFPDPLSPLMGSCVSETFNPGCAAACEELQMPIAGIVNRAFHGWVYNAAPPAAAPDEMPARMARHGAIMADRMATVRERWDRVYLPRVEELIAGIEGLRLAAGGAAAAADLARLLELGREGWKLHFLTVFPKMAVGERFAALYAEATGRQDEMEPYRLLQGEPSMSVTADRALWELARAAERLPDVAAALRDRPAADALAVLDDVPGGAEWRAGLDAFLDAYGHRTHGIELALPTWREDPTFAVENVQRYLVAPALDPEEARLRALAEAERLAAAARERIADPGMRAAFDEALAAARRAWPLEEDHNFHIDQRLFASGFRRAILRAAGRLADEGRLERPEDVWLLTLADLREALAEGVALRDRVAESRRRVEEAARLQPPPLLGRPPDPAQPADPGLAKFFGAPGPPRVEGAVLRGSAGSAGSATGRARVVRALSELEAVRPGEVLVCRATSPPWTPVFASIAALVTEAGGVLSHGAIVAREYGIPAVMGTKVATIVIPDGATVTVDGERGEVTVHS